MAVAEGVCRVELMPPMLIRRFSSGVPVHDQMKVRLTVCRADEALNVNDDR